MSTIKVISIRTLGFLFFFFHLIIIKNDWLVLLKKFKRFVTHEVLPYALWISGNSIINTESQREKSCYQQNSFWLCSTFVRRRKSTLKHI